MCYRSSLWRNDCSELEHESEVVTDVPSLSDAATFKAIQEGNLGGGLESANSGGGAYAG
jgi:hypothetical protein